MVQEEEIWPEIEEIKEKTLGICLGMASQKMLNHIGE
jgi:hypothetical protein